MKLSPKMVTVLQFCALCCLHVACQPCAASHAGGHRSLSSSSSHDSSNEWSVMEDASNTTDATSDSDAKWIENAKYTLMPIIFVLTVFTSALPWYVRRLAKAVEFLTIGACLTAGVILGAALSHLMPDAMEAWEEYNTLIGTSEDEEAYPMVPAVAGAVILLLVWVDALLVRQGMAGNAAHGHSHGGSAAGAFTPADNGHSHMVPALPAEYYALERKLAAEKREKELAKKLAKDPNYGSVAMSPTAVVTMANGDKVHEIPVSTTMPAEGEAHQVTFHNADEPIGTEVVLPTQAATSITIDSDAPTSPTAITVAAISTSIHAHGHGHGHAHGLHVETVPERTPSEAEKIDTLRGSKKQNAQALIFFVALSIHSIFDGLSIGTEDSRDGFSALLVAIGGHKLLDGFALGVPIFFANWSMKTNIAAIVFASLMTPFGIGISMAAHELTDGDQAVLTRAIILAMSLGSFLFISLVELLPAGLDNGKHVNAKMFATSLGWGLMVLLAKYV